MVKKREIMVIGITVKEDGDIIFEFDKKGFKGIKKVGIVEIHPKSVTDNPSFSIKNWNVKGHRKRIIAIKDEKESINRVELNKKVIERKWKQEDKKIFKKR